MTVAHHDGCCRCRMRGPAVRAAGWELVMCGGRISGCSGALSWTVSLWSIRAVFEVHRAAGTVSVAPGVNAGL
jgi:hypothetical protein